jgi:uroporphyrinogen-III synthase
MALPSGPAVVLTREREDNLALATALRERGVPVIELPCIATRYLDEVELPDGMDAVAFTSRRGVKGFLRMEAGPFTDAESSIAVPLVAAVGGATAQALRDAGIAVDLVADPPNGETLAELLRARLRPGSRVALIRGNLRAGEMDSLLAAAGLELHPVEVYENVDCDIPALDRREIAGVLVASPSACRRLLSKNPWLKEASFLCVGRTTAAALAEHGVRSIREIGLDLDGWVDALSKAHRLAHR